MTNVVFVLPTYNERENLIKLLPVLEKIFLGFAAEYTPMVLIVDDNSPDHTADIVRQYMKDRKYLHLLTGEKKGLGAAYVKGMSYATEELKADIIFEMDSDLQHDPYLIPSFLKKIKEGNDIVIGSRYIKEGSIPENWGFKRKLYSVVGNLIVRFGLMIPSIHDWTSGYRALKKDVFEKVRPGLSDYPGYTFQVALLHKAYKAHFKVGEVPLRFEDRNWGESKIIPPEYIMNVIKYILFNSTFLQYLIVGGIGFLLQIFIYHALVYVHVFPGIAAGIGAECAIISNYIFNNYWTFAHKRQSGKKAFITKFVHFQMSSFGAVIIQTIIVSLVTILIGRWASDWAMVISILFIIIPYNYFIYNRLIWKSHKQ